MTALWNLFEVVVNIYQGFISTFLVYKLLGDKKNRTFLKSPAVAFWTAMTVVLCVETFIFPDFLYIAFVYMLIEFIYGVTALNGNWGKKVFTAVYSVLILLLTSVICLIIFTNVLGTDLEELSFTPSAERFIFILSVQLLILYFTFITCRVFKKNDTSDELARMQWLLISCVIVISLMMGAYVFVVNLGTLEHIKPYSMLVMAGLIVVNLIISWLVIDLGEKNKAIRENEILHIQQEYNQQYIDSLRAEYDTVRKMRHDFKNNFLAVYGLLENDEVIAAMEQISQNIGAVSETEVFINTNNAIVNAVVNAKLTSAKSFGVDSTCISVADIAGIDDIDLCRLLSNMLDNAITACQNSSMNKRQIRLQISGDNVSYMFTVKNSIDESVLETNPSLLSTKNDKTEHGYGVKIINEIADKYDGRSDFYEENGMFCCSVYLRRTKD